jgi:hypothetical protein
MKQPRYEYFRLANSARHPLPFRIRDIKTGREVGRTQTANAAQGIVDQLNENGYVEANA